MHYLDRKKFQLKLPVWLRDLEWWILYRIHPKHRYHVLKFGEPGWHDRDHAMLLCCFKLLDDFLAQEPVEMINWTATEKYRRAMTEMRLLHFWWKHQRDRDAKERTDLFTRIWDECVGENPDPFDDPNDDEVGINPLFRKMDLHPLWPEYENLNDYVQTVDQKQLKRLIEIRSFMWT